MYLASVSSCPFRPVLLTLSDPARSTRWSLERRRVAEPGSRLHKCTVKTQWERVDAWFIGVWRREKTEWWENMLKKCLGLCENIFKSSKIGTHGGHTRTKKWNFTLHRWYFPIQTAKNMFPLIPIFSRSCWFEDQSHTMCNRWAVNTWWRLYKSWGWFSDGQWNSRSNVEARRRQK